MRLALIADIHGNTVALDTVLGELRDEEVDEIVCLGDIASDGPDPRGCIARIRETGCPTVLGNTDAAWAQPSPPRTNGDWVEEFDRWSRDQLTAEERAWLGGLEPVLSRTVGGHSLLCFHGSPRSFDDVILAATPSSELTPMLAANEADLLAGGHTHQQLIRRFHSSTIVNPGTVGLPFDGVPASWPPTAEEAASIRNPTLAEYAVVTTHGSRFSIDLRSTRYELDALAELVRRSGMPHAERWLADWR
ncbi:metallophosphoesterase family protein [soil metagenome]